MSAPPRRWSLAGLTFLTLLATAGCNPLTMPFFLLWGLDPKIDPECKLGVGKKKEARVVILTYCSLETRPELLGAERELTSLLATKLSETAKKNKDNFSIVSSSKVQRFKDEHPNWKSLEFEKIGKYFDADYIISLDIASMTLYLPNSNNQLLSGSAELTVTVTDLSKAGEEPIFNKVYNCEYPKSRGPQPVSDTTPGQFRMMFLSRIATDISWYFTGHTVEDHFPCD